MGLLNLWPLTHEHQRLLYQIVGEKHRSLPPMITHLWARFPRGKPANSGRIEICPEEMQSKHSYHYYSTQIRYNRQYKWIWIISSKQSRYSEFKQKISTYRRKWLLCLEKYNNFLPKMIKWIRYKLNSYQKDNNCIIKITTMSKIIKLAKLNT